MSKMSWLHVELTEKANELGFESIEEAEQNGYEIFMDGMTPTLKPNTEKQLELAHKDWLKEKSRVLTNLAQLKIYLSNKVEHFEFCGKDDWEILEDAINFIEKGDN